MAQNLIRELDGFEFYTHRVMQVRLLPPAHVGIITKLMRNERQMASSYTFIGRKSKIATIYVKTYDPGEYVLK